MHCIFSVFGRTIFAAIFVCFACCLVPTHAYSAESEEYELNSLGGIETPWQPGTAIYKSSSFTYRMFTGDEMSDAYDLCFGGYIHAIWMGDSKEAWRIGAGAIIGEGNPIFPDTTWEVSSSELQMFMIPLEASFLYNLRERPLENSLSPYVGIGFGGFIGFERISVEMSRFVEGDFQWNETRFRYVLGGHAVMGTTIKITEKYRAVLEARWTQSGKGSTVKNEFSDEEIAEGWLELDKAVKRPDFNFTSWSVSVGLQW